MADEEQVSRLLAGVDGWNEWRKENPDVKIDLYEADLFVREHAFPVIHRAHNAHYVTGPTDNGNSYVCLQLALGAADTTGKGLGQPVQL